MSPVPAIRRAPHALPMLGHGLSLLHHPLEFLASLPAHGDLVEVQIGPLKAIVVCSPELTHQVLLDDRTFDKGGRLYARLREFASNGLATCSHADHRQPHAGALVPDEVEQQIQCPELTWQRDFGVSRRTRSVAANSGEISRTRCDFTETGVRGRSCVVDR